MPYIKQDRRVALADNSLYDDTDPQNAGELNYAITIVLLNYWHHKGHSYQTINDIVGACSGAVHEFERRIVGKYEDTKIAENGDVYP